jgi:Uma2 family endonuclease
MLLQWRAGLDMARVPLREEQTGAVVLNIEGAGLSPEQFFQLCSDNPELHLELSARKELVIMTLPGGKTGRRNTLICTQLTQWAESHRTGPVFGPSTLFALPNGALRAPDASWIRGERWNTLTDEQQEGAPPLCPDFVLELRSASDRLQILQEKMTEYLDNGAQLGWLIDPFQKRVYVYRPGLTMQILENPVVIEGDPVLPGFVLKISRIW